jgi:hypothetical protein
MGVPILKEYMKHPCRCDPKYTIVAVVVAVNGVRHYKYMCEKCGKWLSAPISVRKLDRDTIANAPVKRVNTGNRGECERCGDLTAVERHHWAPAALFEDSYDWPTSLLCVECHRHWHEVMKRASLEEFTYIMKLDR